MKVDLYSEKGIKAPTKIELPKEVFASEPNETALRQYIHAYRINQRRGTASTKTRGEVRGGGRKPWPQKGTGRARHGSIRSPLWVGGGVTHGPRPRDFKALIPKKIRNLALRSALSEKAVSGRIQVLKDFVPKAPKTARAAQLLGKLKLKEPLIVLPEANELVLRSFRNIRGVRVKTVSELNPYEVVAAGDLLFFKESIAKLKERLGSHRKDARRSSLVSSPVRKDVPPLAGLASSPTRKLTQRVGSKGKQE